jgi:hypothetical protein
VGNAYQRRKGSVSELPLSGLAFQWECRSNYLQFVVGWELALRIPFNFEQECFPSSETVSSY